MDKNKKKNSKPSVWERLMGKPSGPSKAEAKPKDNRPSIAEQINWGGQFPDKKEKPQKSGQSY